MENALKKLIKQRVGNKKYPTLLRIKIGRVLSVIAALPLCTSPLFLISIPMMLPVSLKTWTKGKLNERKGNGDLI